MNNVDNKAKLKKYLCRKPGFDVCARQGEELDKAFEDISEILLNKCIVVAGDKKYRILEIEFYLFSPLHQDIITYPRDNMSGGEWFFHQSGVDLCFKSCCKTKRNSTYHVFDTNNKFGGILIRSMMELDAENRPVINGPMKCVDRLFKKFDAFFSEKRHSQIAYIETDIPGWNDTIEKTIRHIPVNSKLQEIDKIPNDSIRSKVKTIFSEYYDQEPTEKCYNEFRDYLGRDVRYYIDNNDCWKYYHANPVKSKERRCHNTPGTV